MRDMDNKTTGFTLIEMLVGIVIGMIVVAAASVMMVSVLKSQKDITASARLNQELGAAMAVMSNEIRRAGFNVCDENTHVCNDAVTGIPLVSYALGEDIQVYDDGDCILYRYNADVDNNPDDQEEYRGFRLNGDIIQMAGPAGNVTCTSGIWVNLTNPDIIKVSKIEVIPPDPAPPYDLKIFSTAGSKCRNMTKNIYWVAGGNAIGLACDADTVLDGDCVDLNDPVAGHCVTGATTVPLGSVWVNDVPSVSDYPLYTLFGVNQIRISLRATLTRDSAVSKNLQTSVKVANPWTQVKK